MFNEEFNTLRYKAKFSMDEIIPVLEEKISSIKGEDYKIDFFVTNDANARTLEVRYLAFPKQESYVNALFSYNGFLYQYTRKDENHSSLTRTEFPTIDTSDTNFKDMLGIKESDRVFLLAREEIQINESFVYLTMPKEEKYHLFDEFFCYDENLDEISETIIQFTKKKIPRN